MAPQTRLLGEPDGVDTEHVGHDAVDLAGGPERLAFEKRAHVVGHSLELRIEASAVGVCFGELLAGFGGRLLRFLQVSLGASYAIVALSHHLGHPRPSLDDHFGVDDTAGHLAFRARAVEKLGD